MKKFEVFYKLKQPGLQGELFCTCLEANSRDELAVKLTKLPYHMDANFSDIKLGKELNMSYVCKYENFKEWLWQHYQQNYY